MYPVRQMGGVGKFLRSYWPCVLLWPAAGKAPERRLAIPHRARPKPPRHHALPRPERDYVPFSRLHNGPALPKPTGPARSTAKVSVIRSDAAKEAALAVAFEQYENLPATCPVETVPGTV